MREIHDEETSWRARPDWARDGKRVVYSSYVGRQRNGLWLTTGDGGHPFELTYGDYDATNPRWSPDGSVIAYISNEGGNTSLWTVALPGGQRARSEAGFARVSREDGECHGAASCLAEWHAHRRASVGHDGGWPLLDAAQRAAPRR